MATLCSVCLGPQTLPCGRIIILCAVWADGRSPPSPPAAPQRRKGKCQEEKCSLLGGRGKHSLPFGSLAPAARGTGQTHKPGPRSGRSGRGWGLNQPCLPTLPPPGTLSETMPVRGPAGSACVSCQIQIGAVLQPLECGREEPVSVREGPRVGADLSVAMYERAR